jgi:hypothetical protein
MTDINSFVSDNTDTTKVVNQSTENQIDKKSLEGQLAIVQKRLDDQLSFIETLKSENRSLREQTESAARIEDLMSRLDKSQIENVGQPTTNTSPVNIDDLKKQGFITKEDLDRQRLASVQAENFDKVSSAMIRTYGEDKYLDVVKLKSKELGMTLEQIDHLAKNNPTAAMKLLEATKGATSTSTLSTGSINTQAINNNQSPSQPKSVMYGASTKDLINNWKAAGEIVKHKMEQGN